MNNMFELPYPTVIILAAIVALAVIVWVMGKPNLRHRFVGESSFTNAAVPVVAAGLVWIANWSGELLVNVVSDSTAPESNLSVFIEDIKIGHPRIPQDYKERSLSHDELNKMLQKFKLGSKYVLLKDDEADRLNRINRKSYQAGVGAVTTDRAYPLAKLGNLIKPSMYFYYRYIKWGNVTRNWNNFFVENQETKAGNLIHDFVSNKVRSVPDSAGIFQAITGMIALDELEIYDYDMMNCKSTVAEYNIFMTKENGKNYIDWGPFRSQIDDDKDRIKAASRLLQFISRYCTEKLASIFLKAAAIFQREAKFMQKYLDEWQKILLARKPDSVEVLVTISNVGKFDTYVRREVRAAIGGKGEENKIRFNLIGDFFRKKSDSNVSMHVPVKSRSANTLRFRATLKGKDKENVYGAFSSGLNYIRIGVLASSGGSNRVVLSPTVAFSKEAKKRAIHQIENMKVDF